MGIQHRQQRQTDPAVGGGLGDAQGQFGRIGVVLAVAVVVHIVEFGNTGVAGLEHLDIELAGDDLDLLRLESANQPVHQLAPGPEAVVGIAGNFGQASHRTLEGMRVEVGHTRQHRPGQAFGAFR
ncbi:hypothetical protein D3C76_560320 [compost metagenome]